MRRAKKKIVKLGEVARIRRGFTTGANDFFYLEVIEKSEKDATLKVRNSLGWIGYIEEDFLKPIIKSSEECDQIIINPNKVRFRIFICNKNKSELKGKNALKYIEWGEKQGFNKRQTCKNRREWYYLPDIKPADIIFPYIVGKFLQKFINFYEVYNSDDMHCIYTDKEIKQPLWWFLNSTLCYLQYEVMGRAMVGIHKLQTYELKNFILVFNRNLLIELKERMKGNIETKKMSVFDEIGIDPNKPIREQEPKPLHGRKELDKIIFDILGLTEEERKEVYWSVCELVKQRLDKAKSLKKREKSGESS